MANPFDSDSNNGLETFVIIIKALQEHERNLDTSIDKLVEKIDQIADLTIITTKLETIENSIDILQSDIKKLTANILRT
jgi:chaperonin cofactor prefoldin